MSADMDSCTVADIAAPIRNALVGGPFGSNLVSKDYRESGVPVIRGQNMGHGRWVTGEFAFVSPQKAKELSANTAKPGDLIFTQRGTLGQVAIIPNKPYEKYVISQSQMKLTVDDSKADRQFLYYLFCSSEQQAYIKTNTIQVGVPHTNLGILKRTPINLPSIEEQLGIVNILGTLDDKIELNRQINQTLEQMAQAIFKSWFVDFDPVHAKVQAIKEGRDPIEAAARVIGNPALEQIGAPLREIAELFPSEFVESELGLIPKGWGVAAFSSIAKIKGGKQLERSHFQDDGKNPVFGGAGVMGRTDLSNASGFVISVGRVGAYCGQFFCYKGNVWVNNNASHIQPIYSEESVWIYEWLKSVDVEPIKKGAAQPFVSNGDIAALQVTKPPIGLRINYSGIANDVYDRLAANNLQVETLSTLRDTLLPKLLSGEIRVGDVEQHVWSVQ